MQSLPLSISTSFDYSIPLEEQLPLIAEAGFSHFSLGGNESHSGYRTATSRSAIKRQAAELGLGIDTIHGSRADAPDAINVLTETAHAAKDLGARVVVFHASAFDFPAETLQSRYDTVMATCDALYPVAQDAGIVFALENVLPGPATDIVRKLLPALDTEHFGFCYDSSHDQIGGPRAFTLLEEQLPRLAAVHLSDRARDFVDHMIPGEGFIDLSLVMAHIRKSPFHGPLLMEVMTTHSRYKEPREFLTQVRSVASDLATLS